MAYEFTLCDLSDDIKVVARDFDPGFYEYVRYTAVDGKKHQVGMNEISPFSKKSFPTNGLKDAITDLKLTTLHGSIALGDLLEAIYYGREHVKGANPGRREYDPNPNYDPAKAAEIFKKSFTSIQLPAPEQPTRRPRTRTVDERPGA